MRHCIYCGMPMEDDDLFCTRCGNEAAPKRMKAASKGAKTGPASAGSASNAKASVSGGMKSASNAKASVPGGMKSAPDAKASAAGGMKFVSDEKWDAGMEADHTIPVLKKNSASVPENREKVSAAVTKKESAPVREKQEDSLTQRLRQRDPEPRGSRKAGSRRGMIYGGSDAGFSAEDGGDKPDVSRYLMIGAIAVVALVFCSLLFMLFRPASGRKDTGEKNTVATYDDNNRQEENLNQGQQTPASGQAASSYARNTQPSSGSAQNEYDSAAQQNNAQSNAVDPAPAGQKTEETAVEAQNPTSDDESAEAQDPSHDESVEAQKAEDADVEENTEQEDEYIAEDDEDYETGWVTDEDGNEVYYPDEDESLSDNNQTVVDGEEDSGAAVAAQTIDQTAEEEAAGSVVDQEVTADMGLSGDNVTAEDGSEYILADSGSRYYTREELEELDDYSLQMAINEVYARHGRKFDTDSIRDYFESKSWYQGTIDPEVFDAEDTDYFNEYEEANNALLAEIRSERMAAAEGAVQQQ